MKLFKPAFEALSLCFTRYAWEKIVHLNSLSHNEVGAFGISNSENLLLVEDLVVVKQEVTAASVKFDDEAVNEFIEDQYDAGRRPEQVMRIWIHTHPNWVVDCKVKNIQERLPAPSGRDEETFKDAFGKCDWSIMFIYGGGRGSYARLALRNSFISQGEIIIPVSMCNGKMPNKKERKAWDKEFEENVTASKIVISGMGFGHIPYISPIKQKAINLAENNTFEEYLMLFNIKPSQFKKLDQGSKQYWWGEYERDRQAGEITGMVVEEEEATDFDLHKDYSHRGAAKRYTKAKELCDKCDRVKFCAKYCDAYNATMKGEDKSEPMGFVDEIKKADSSDDIDIDLFTEYLRENGLTPEEFDTFSPSGKTYWKDCYKKDMDFININRDNY